MTTNGTGHWSSLVEGYDPVMSSNSVYLKLLSGVTALLPAYTMCILDLGCETGALSFLCSCHFPNAEVAGLDPAPKAVAEAERRRRTDPRISFMQGNAASLSVFSADSFDAMVSNFAVHHLTHPDKQACAEEVFRVFKPGGRVINSDQHCKVMEETSDPGTGAPYPRSAHGRVLERFFVQQWLQECEY
jgi:ubiquinone/menaquinone biosynthesis C-methylase UbiE